MTCLSLFLVSLRTVLGCIKVAAAEHAQGVSAQPDEGKCVWLQQMNPLDERMVGIARMAGGRRSIYVRAWQCARIAVSGAAYVLRQKRWRFQVAANAQASGCPVVGAIVADEHQLQSTPVSRPAACRCP